MAQLDDVKKAAIAAAISAYLSNEGAGDAPFRPTMFLRDIKGSGAWGRLSRKALGGSSDYRGDSVKGGRSFYGGNRG